MRIPLSTAGCLLALAFTQFAGTARAADEPGFNDRLLAAHNAERVRVGAPLLKWDDALSKSAAKWAAELAKTATFEHDNQDKEGENLWEGSATTFQPEEMVGSWIDERKDFRNGVFPNVSRTPDWRDVGHYTQLIWKTTTHVGCAKASNKENDILVCRYFPTGNWEGVQISATPVSQIEKPAVQLTAAGSSHR